MLDRAESEEQQPPSRGNRPEGGRERRHLCGAHRAQGTSLNSNFNCSTGEVSGVGFNGQLTRNMHFRM